MQDKRNPWHNCKSDPPPQYHRVEIKDKNNDRYIGYRYGNTYYETYGNYLIKNPTCWREPPKGSQLLADIKEKIHINIGGEAAYGFLGE